MKSIICLGNALVDQVTQIENDHTLEELSLPKGSMQLVDREQYTKIKEYSSGLKISIQTGGSAANTANGIANLNIKSGYIGMVGKDENGEFYIEDMRENFIEPKFFISDSTPTGSAIAFVSQDGERTFATYLGAAIELNAEHINESLFEGYNIFHIEGYLISNQELIQTAINTAKSQGLKVSIDLASYNVVEENLEFIRELCKNVDIIFANEEEAKSFSGGLEDEDALDFIADYAEIAIVKLGKRGSLIKHNNKTYIVEETQREVKDTTGAGDMYAAGFLAGLSMNKDVETCGRMGSILAGNVIEVYGAKMDKERWKKIKQELDLLG